jgi:hypothetical protein
MKNRKTSDLQRMNIGRRTLIVIGAIVAVLLVVYGVFEYAYQQRINTLSTTIDQVWQNPTKTIAGVDSSTYIKAPHYLDSFCTDNGPCPTVTRSWLVLVDPNQEIDFIRNAFQQVGYQATIHNYQDPGAAGVGFKNHVTLSVGFYAPGNNDHPPYQAPSGKIWRSFSVDAFETAN